MNSIIHLILVQLTTLNPTPQRELTVVKYNLANFLLIEITVSCVIWYGLNASLYTLITLIDDYMIRKKRDLRYSFFRYSLIQFLYIL